MKRLILFLFMIPLFATAQNEWLIEKTIENSRTYKQRFLPDGGLIKSDNISKAFYAMSKKNEMADNIQFAWFGEAASKKRTSGIQDYYSKLYSTVGTNDATQTTEASQPYVSGNIAPNERQALINPNGSSRYITHPTISFGASDAWSVTSVLNWNGSNNDRNGLFEDVVGGIFGYIDFRVSNANTIYLINGSAGSTQTYGSSNNLIGKNSILTFVCSSTGLIKYYLNGVYVTEKQHTDAAIIFNKLMYAVTANRGFTGKLYAHIIRSGALTQSQVTAEYNFFRSIYPEITTVKIGTQNWATSNLDVVANSAGTVIPDGSVQATWIGGTSFWCYHTDVATGAIYGKLYNKAARNVIIASPPSGYHVSTEAELTTLALNGGYKLKKEGTNYWTTANGTNSTGFSALGGSSRNADGTFNAIKNTASFWCADSDKILLLNHADNTATITAATANQGHSIRLIKD